MILGTSGPCLSPTLRPESTANDPEPHAEPATPPTFELTTCIVRSGRGGFRYRSCPGTSLTSPCCPWLTTDTGAGTATQVGSAVMRLHDDPALRCYGVCVSHKVHTSNAARQAAYRARLKVAQAEPVTDPARASNPSDAGTCSNQDAGHLVEASPKTGLTGDLDRPAVESSGALPTSDDPPSGTQGHAAQGDPV